ncbi:MAG: serine/threonine protein kinase [Candidatus Obscuribacterales bacterium]|nr:serine/threonine protein kinase [Candidatus Obscuribacterales bacterium]
MTETKESIIAKVLAAANPTAAPAVAANSPAEKQLQRQNLTPPGARSRSSLQSSAAVDSIIVGITGGIISAATMALAMPLLPGLATMPDALLRAVDICAGAGCVGGIFFFICYFNPIWLGLILLCSQILSGVLVGKVVTDFLTVWSGSPDLGPVGVLLTMLFTIVFTLLPTFARPLYEAFFQSSRLQNTPADCFYDFNVSDRQGRRLTFAKAWKRSCLKSFENLLYQWSLFRGKNYKNPQEWLEEASATSLTKKARRQDDELQVSKSALLVRYRAFHEMEFAFRLDRNKYAARNISESDKSLMRGRALVRCIGVVMGWTILAAACRCPQGIYQTCVLANAPTDFALWSLLAVIALAVAEKAWWIVLSLAVLYGLFATCRPTHVEISKKGLRIIGTHMPWWIRDPILPWEKVVRIGLELPKGKSSVADHWLVFYAKDGTRRRLRVGSIDTTTAREEILKAIERWAPKVPRDVEVIKALQAPCDYSYTDLWLEALSSPPKRDRLEPLIEGAQLKSHQYSVVRMLGCGGQGTAYLASDVLAGEEVVLKEFMLPVFVDVNIRRKALGVFEQEARLLKELSHPQVVRLLDYFVEDHRAYLVLEHIDGMSLSQKVKQDGPLAENEVIALCLQMCEILQYLASRPTPVVHRDFTPDNLILNSNGTLKLIDFNVAHQDSTDGTTGTVVGKTAYMPPEQFRGEPSLQSDLYAMGATAYFLLVGQDPVPISCSSPALDGAEVSPELNLVIQKLTEPDLRSRLRKVSDAKAMLESAIRLSPEEELEKAVRAATAQMACASTTDPLDEEG